MKNSMKIIIIVLTFSSYVLALSSGDKKLDAFNKSIKSESIYNYSEAVKYLENVYSDLKEDYLTNLRLGWLYYLTKDYKKSIEYYGKAAKLSNDSVESLLGLVYPYSALNNWDKVESIYKKILDKDPNNYTATLNLSIIYFNGQKFLNSKVLLEKLYTLYPSDYSVNLYLGWNYYYLGAASKAQQRFIDALIAKPEDTSALEGYKLTK